MDKNTDYVNKGKIGEGGSGVVYLVQHKQTKQYFAMKEYSKSNLNDHYHLKLFQNEVEIMKQLKNIESNHIVKMLKIMNSANHFYVLMEYCNMGNLNDHLKDNPHLSEFQLVQIMIQIISGLQTLRNLRIIHRDIKAENILIHDNTIKIADFGFSIMLDCKEQRQNSESVQLEKSALLGTPPYLAPELINNRVKEYSSKVDVWALGVLYFYMLFKKFPFYYVHNNDIYISRNINRFLYIVRSYCDFVKSVEYVKQFLLEHYKLERISYESKVFLNEVFKVDPKERLGWDQIYQHDLVWKYYDQQDNSVPDENPINKVDYNQIFNNIKKHYNQYKDNIFFIKFIIQQLLINSKVIQKLQDQQIYYVMIKQFVFHFKQFLKSIDEKENIMNLDSIEYNLFFNSNVYQTIRKTYKEINEQLLQFQCQMNQTNISINKYPKVFAKLEQQSKQQDSQLIQTFVNRLMKVWYQVIQESEERREKEYPNLLECDFDAVFIKQNKKDIKNIQINLVNLDEQKLIGHLSSMKSIYSIKL